MNRIQEYCEDESNCYGAGMIIFFLVGAATVIAMVRAIPLLEI